MFRLARSDIAIAALAAAAAIFGMLGSAGFGVRLSDGFLFVACLLTLLALFMLGFGVPRRGGGSPLSAWVVTALISCAAIAIAIAANVALYRHDLHFDVTREGRNTPPRQLTEVVEHLHTPLALTYFYNAGDPNAVAVRELIAIAARNHQLLAFRSIDIDKEPALERHVNRHSYD